jgi:hypothetical protein
MARDADIFDPKQSLLLWHDLPGRDAVRISLAESGKRGARLRKPERGRGKSRRGKDTMKDGIPLSVTLDLKGNIHSTLSKLFIRIEQPPANR